MANSDAGQLSEDISTFTFRDKGSIRIPKSKREIAYIQCVDIFIDSISYTSYRSEKTEPDESFYGYGTLVFQDALSDKIPLRFGRNRIYQIRNEIALAQWEFHRQFFAVKTYIDSYYRAITEPDAPLVPATPPKPRFVELPLREVYVECTPNTQFQIEYTQWQPIGYTTDNSVSINGKSDQDDGDKDGGLPPFGSQPRQNPSGDPYKNNSNASNQSQLGDFFNSKFGVSGENSNLNNEGNEGLDDERFWVQSVSQCEVDRGSGCEPRTEKYSYYLPSEGVCTLSQRFTSGGCNGGLVDYNIIFSADGSIVGATGTKNLNGGSVGLVYGYGLKPDTSITYP